MSNKMLSIIWGGLYVLCVAMSFFSSPQGAQYGALVLLGMIFFVPGAVLLYRGVKSDNERICRWICLLSAVSLFATLVMIIVNFLTYNASEAVGMAMYILLAVVSAPMLCGQVWALSLFLWACLLMVSWTYLRKHKQK